MQFGESLGSFELVKDKIAYMAAGAFAMEACTYQTAALIDAGEDDYMLETAMLKVFATDVLWRIINDTIQILRRQSILRRRTIRTHDARRAHQHDRRGGQRRAARLLGPGRHARRRPGVERRARRVHESDRQFQQDRRFCQPPHRLAAQLARGSRPQHELQDDAARVGRLVGALGTNVERLLRKYREAIVDRQYHLERIADSATELYVSSCILQRFEALMADQSARKNSASGNWRPGDII